MKANFSQTTQRFSIRKYSFGAASVLLGTLFLMAGPVVNADEVSQVQPNNSEPVVTLVSGESNQGNETSNNIVSEKSLGDAETTIINDSEKQEDNKINEAITPLTDIIPLEVDKSVKDNASNELETKDEKTLINQDNTSTPSESHITGKSTLENENNVTDLKKESNIDKDDDLDVINSFLEENSDKSDSNNVSTRSDGTIGDDYPREWKANIFYPGTNTYQSDSWGFARGNCTSFVANRLHSVNKFEPTGAFGDGGQWGYSAQRMGYRVDKNPSVGSVAWEVNNGYGHVAWVAAVSGDKVLVEEYNWNWDHSYHNRWMPNSAYTGFIHFKDLSQPVSSGISPISTTPSNNVVSSSGTYYFTKRVGIKNEPNMSSPDIAYYGNGNSVHYDKTLEADNHQWISYVSYSGARRYIAIKELAKKQETALTGTINIQNKNDQAGTFDVVVSNVSNNGGLKEVKLPIWSSQNGQDDIVWYNAVRQYDGTYKSSVNIQNHKGDRGEYNIHLYYIMNDGKPYGVATATASIGVSQPQDNPRPSIPSSGRYIFSGHASIRPTARMDAPELAYYDSGDSVYYDQVLSSDGHYWISYIASSGNRRFISIT